MLHLKPQEPNGDENVESQQGPMQSKETKGLDPNKDSNNVTTTVGVGLGGRKRSAIWGYFVRIDKFTVSCNTCKNEVRCLIHLFGHMLVNRHFLGGIKRLKSFFEYRVCQ